MTMMTKGKTIAGDRRARISRLRLRAKMAAAAFATVFALATGVAQRAQAQTYTVFHSFVASRIDPGGSSPFGGLVVDSAGNLYGTTSYGGVYGYGTVFKLDTSGNETVLHSFTNSDGDGAFPFSGLVMDAARNLYGTTYGGGSSSFGTVFKLDSLANETVLHSFTGRPDDGAFPLAGLLMDAAGDLYGTTQDGGAYGQGTVFKLDTSGDEVVLHSFSRPYTDGPGADGAYPQAGLVMDAAGNLYGTASGAGAFGWGTVFKLDTSGNLTVLHTFTNSGGDGADPIGGLVMDVAGNLYGTTFGGGSSTFGTVFKLDSSGNETVLYSFAGPVFGGPGADGALSQAGLIMDLAGNLYGTTGAGGPYGYGTVFKLDPSGKETVLHSFTGSGGDGLSPSVPLVMDTAGSLFGTTTQGGAYGNFGYGYGGTVFKLTLSEPFAAFAAKLHITPPGFVFDGAFTLGAGAAAINPATQGMTLNVGTYSLVIPAGAFVARPNGAFAFEGAINGARLEIRIAPTGAEAYRIHVMASGVNLTALTNPVPVTLTIGNNAGTTAVTAAIR